VCYKAVAGRRGWTGKSKTCEHAPNKAVAGSVGPAAVERQETRGMWQGEREGVDWGGGGGRAWVLYRAALTESTAAVKITGRMTSPMVIMSITDGFVFLADSMMTVAAKATAGYPGHPRR